MVRKKQKVVVIVGQTSSGKSSLAVELARKYDGEIVSADSRQVYRGLDIGTGKVTKYEMRGIPHHLLGVANPRQPYSAGNFVDDARKAIVDIAARGKVPIVAGGTGFFIDAALGSVTLPAVPPDPTLRAKLEKRDTAALFKELGKRDPRRAKTVDPNNKRRLIRAIEVVRNTPYYSKDCSPYDILKIGVAVPPKTLEKKISARLGARVKRGLVAEVQRLHERGLSWHRMEELGLEYRYVSRYLRGMFTREEMIDRLLRAITRYAKRQKLWFSYDKKTRWFRPSEIKKIEKAVEKFLQG